MATYTVPIAQIRATSAYSSGLAYAPFGNWYKRINVFYAAPKAIQFIVKALSNERLAALSHSEASELYMPLAAMTQELARIVTEFDSLPWMLKIALRGWLKRIRDGHEKLSDITEALAWSAQPELQSIINRSVNALEQYELRLT